MCSQNATMLNQGDVVDAVVPAWCLQARAMSRVNDTLIEMKSAMRLRTFKQRTAYHTRALYVLCMNAEFYLSSIHRCFVERRPQTVYKKLELAARVERMEHIFYAFHTLHPKTPGRARAIQPNTYNYWTYYENRCQLEEHWNTFQ